MEAATDESNNILYGPQEKRIEAKRTTHCSNHPTSQPSNIHGSTASVRGSNIQHLEFCKRDHKNQIFSSMFSFGRFSLAIGVRFYILGRNKHPKFHKTACSVLCPIRDLCSMIGNLLQIFVSIRLRLLSKTPTTI